MKNHWEINVYNSEENQRFDSFGKFETAKEAFDRVKECWKSDKECEEYKDIKWVYTLSYIEYDNKNNYYYETEYRIYKYKGRYKLKEI